MVLAVPVVVAFLDLATPLGAAATTVVLVAVPVVERPQGQEASAAGR